VVPSGKDEGGRPLQPPGEAEEQERWRAAANEAFAPFVARARRFEPDLLASEDCSLLSRLVQTSVRALPLQATPGSGSELGSAVLRFEQFGFAPEAADRLDPEWVEQVQAGGGRGLVGPFASRFGLHLVFIARIEPASLADGSLPPDELAKQRDAYLRERIRDQWRAEQFAIEVQRIREARIVRMAESF
jgi:hypothetical protein